MIERLLLSVILSIAILDGAAAAPRQIEVEEETLGKAAVLAPAEEPTSYVAVLSDQAGITDATRSVAEKLVAGGAAVLLVDTPKFVDGLAKGDEDECHYAFGDIEDAGRTAQRALGMKQW